MKDMASNIDVRPAINPYDHATGDAVITTEICNLQGYNSCTLVISYGSIADSDVTFATVLYEDLDADATMGSETAVDDKDLIGTEALASPLFSDDDKVYKLGYIGNAQYIRATITPTNNTGDLLMSAVWVLGDPDSAPRPNPPSNPATSVAA
jgi:7-cyano-7-deazaguanine synthase in queuosine biosynthesis